MRLSLERNTEPVHVSIHNNHNASWFNTTSLPSKTLPSIGIRYSGTVVQWRVLGFWPQRVPYGSKFQEDTPG